MTVRSGVVMRVSPPVARKYQALPTGTLAAETTDAHIGRLVKALDTLLSLDRLRIVALRRISNREQDHLATIRQLMDAEVARVPSAGHEVASGGRLIDWGCWDDRSFRAADPSRLLNET